MNLLHDLYEDVEGFDFGIAMVIDDGENDSEGIVCVSHMETEVFQHLQDRMLDVYLRHDNIDSEEQIKLWEDLINKKKDNDEGTNKEDN